MIVVLWFQDIDGAELISNAVLMKEHKITHVIWSLGTWREGYSPNYEFWHTPSKAAVDALHAQGIKCIAHFMNTWPGAPAPVNVDNAAYNTARINSATQLVQTYGFDGFASADESWTGSEDNFISYNNQLYTTLHALGKEYWFINMCYEGMGWSVSKVYGNIICDYLLPELYDGVGAQDLGFWLQSFNTCLSVAKTPVVVGVCAGRGTDQSNLGLDLAYVLKQLQVHIQTLNVTQKANLVGIDVYGARADSPNGNNPLFMWPEDWQILDAYLKTQVEEGEDEPPTIEVKTLKFSGTVKNKKTLEAVSGALVTIVMTDPDLAVSALTATVDENGFFKTEPKIISVLGVYLYTTKVSKAGFKDAVVEQKSFLVSAKLGEMVVTVDVEVA